LSEAAIRKSGNAPEFFIEDKNSSKALSANEGSLDTTSNISDTDKDWQLLDENGKVLTNKQANGEKMIGFVKGRFFDTRYKVSTGKQTQGLNFFQMILKFLATDSIEITRENHLPMSLFHYKFKKVRTQEEFTKVKKDF
jgi:hypothetical protein